jgi:hypothetical protein
VQLGKRAHGRESFLAWDRPGAFRVHVLGRQAVVQRVRNTCWPSRSRGWSTGPESGRRYIEMRIIRGAKESNSMLDDVSLDQLPAAPLCRRTQCRVRAVWSGRRLVCGAEIEVVRPAAKHRSKPSTKCRADRSRPEINRCIALWLSRLVAEIRPSAVLVTGGIVATPWRSRHPRLPGSKLLGSHQVVCTQWRARH